MTAPLVLAETAAVLEFLAAQEGPHLSELPATDMREVYRQLGDAFDSPAETGIRTVDFAGPDCALRAYFPGAAQPGPVIVYMHGGGWVIGDLETHHALCGLIARLSGLRVVAVDYRLAPEHPFPRAHEDCLAATAFVASNPTALEAPVTGIAVAGDSAGGNLAFFVSDRLGREKVLGQLLIYPVGDCTGPAEGSYRDFAEGYLLDRRLMDRFISDYLPDTAQTAQRDVSPLLHDLDTANLPPAVIMTAGLDPLRDQGRELADRIIAGGVETHYIEAAGLIHGMATMRKAFPSGEQILRRAIAIFTDVIRTELNKREEGKA
ncbi:putative esterase [Caenibius tardaugens NBRC 16725]|uniref:Putative esterase n=1 Tax=Caenibius tardaugens NBRC 16725 TaxID=1219035 RepID=U2YP48_9SPHN|nr:alpha/beta hydrolase [Caenibius tardaugens]AZI35762.1 alpha/beta hydrolase [Caenibius tardaugens NBRC 16725]GAD50680.1 putative esterase [Caenibius tardaugens NBRC 16725]